MLLKYYKPPTTSQLSGQQYSVNLHNLDPGLSVVNVTLQNGAQLQLNKGTTLYSLELFASELVTGLGLPTYPEYQSPNYNQTFTYSTITNFDMYYSTGGPKQASQYITHLTIDNTMLPIPTTIYASDGQNNWYPFITVPGKTTGVSVAWVGQSFSLNSDGSNKITLTANTNTLITVTARDGLVIGSYTPAPLLQPNQVPTVYDNLYYCAMSTCYGGGCSFSGTNNGVGWICVVEPGYSGFLGIGMSNTAGTCVTESGYSIVNTIFNESTPGIYSWINSINSQGQYLTLYPNSTITFEPNPTWGGSMTTTSNYVPGATVLFVFNSKGAPIICNLGIITLQTLPSLQSKIEGCVGNPNVVSQVLQLFGL